MTSQDAEKLYRAIERAPQHSQQATTLEHKINDAFANKVAYQVLNQLETRRLLWKFNKDEQVDEIWQKEPLAKPLLADLFIELGKFPAFIIDFVLAFLFFLADEIKFKVLLALYTVRLKFYLIIYR